MIHSRHRCKFSVCSDAYRITNVRCLLALSLKEALDSLNTTLQSLLPPVAEPALRPLLFLQPTRVIPTGLGGYVGINQDPPGDILGQRLDVLAVVTVQANDVADLDTATTNTTRSLLQTDRITLRTNGIFQLNFDTLGPKPPTGAATPLQRDL